MGVQRLFYFLVYALGFPPMWIAARPIVLHRDRSCRKGAYLLLCNHFSPYDIPCLIKETRRVIHFVSVIEVFRNPLSRWFLGAMGAFPLNRWKPDSPTVRIMLDRLRRGYVVAMFPEGNIRNQATSVLNGGPMKGGAGRIARMADVPILPCVIIGSTMFHKPLNWLPNRIRYGLIYGEPIKLTTDAEAEPKVFDARLRQIFLDLHAELKAAMDAPSGPRRTKGN